MKVKNLLVFLMSAALSSVSVDVLASVEVDGICYNILSEVGKTVEVAENPGGYSGDIVIPEQVIIEGESYTVAAIGDYAFEGCRELTSIDISEGVASIGMRSFIACSKLTSVDFPTNLKSIGEEAFVTCQNLTSIVVPERATLIGKKAFRSSGADFGCAA